MDLINFLLELLVIALVFGCIAWFGFWILDRSKAPQPAYWVVGLILIIALVYIVVGLFGNGMHAHWQILR